jgi:hypothetical protein
MEFEQEFKAPEIALNVPIYNAKHVRLGTFFGGPLVGGYFIAENYKAFGEYGKANTTWIYSIAATIIRFSSVFLIPEMAYMPNYISPIAYCWIAYYLVEHFQGDQINAHAATGHAFFGWGRVVLIGFIGLAITIALLLTAIIEADDLSS